MAKGLTLRGRDYDTKMSLGARMWKYKSFYFFLLPALIWYAIFHYYPMYGVLIAFKNFKFNLGILGSEWVGLRYFNNFLGDSYFWNIVKNTLVISVLSRLQLKLPHPL